MNRGFVTGRFFRVSILVVLASAAAVEAPGKRPPSATNPGDLVITVGVYDYVGIPEGALIHAEEQTKTIFQEAGVQLQWINCVIPRGDYARDSACAGIPRLRDVELRIVHEIRPNLTEGGEDTAGLAMGRMGTVLFSRVDRMARFFNLSRSQVLSCVMAHELGHVLLPGAAHSPGGVMRTVWSKDELLRLFAHAEPYFTSEQAESLRREVRTQMQRSKHQ